MITREDAEVNMENVYNFLSARSLRSTTSAKLFLQLHSTMDSKGDCLQGALAGKRLGDRLPFLEEKIASVNTVATSLAEAVKQQNKLLVATSLQARGTLMDSNVHFAPLSVGVFLVRKPRVKHLICGRLVSSD